MDHVVCYAENSERYIYQLSEKNCEKADRVKGGWYVGSTKGGGSEGSGGKPVGKNLHQTNTGYSGTVGGAVANIQGIHKGDMI